MTWVAPRVDAAEDYAAVAHIQFLLCISPCGE
jgi:hypothetical protein